MMEFGLAARGPLYRRRASAAGSVALALAVSASAGVSVARTGLVPMAFAGGLLAVAVCVVVARLGERGLLAYLCVAGVAYPFVRYPASHALVTLDRIWIPGLALAALAFRNRFVAPASTMLARAVMFLVLAWSVRAITTPPLRSSIETWLDALLLPALLFVAARFFISTRDRLADAAAALAAGGTAIALIGLGQAVFGYDLAARTGGSIRFDHIVDAVRISGPYPVPEVFALILLGTGSATGAWIRCGRPRARMLGSIALAIQFVAVGLTLFRAAWLGAAAITIAIVALGDRRRARRLVAVAALVAVALAGGAFLHASGRFSARVHNTDNIAGRIATYEQGVEMFRSHPLAGVGVGRFVTVQSTLPATSYDGVEAVPYAHSSFVSTLAEQGLLGFLPLLFVTFAVWRLGRRYRRCATDPVDVAFAAASTAFAFGLLVMSATLTMLPYGPSNEIVGVILGVAAGRLDSIEAGGESE